MKKLFGFRDRDEAHQKLAEVLAEGTYPFACCREDPNNQDEPFQVWDDDRPEGARAKEIGA